MGVGTKRYSGRATKRATARTELLDGFFGLSPETKRDLFGDLRRSNRRLVVIDATVYREYGTRVEELLGRYGMDEAILTMPGGEDAKTFASVERIIEAMDDFGVPRFGEVIGFGGGVLHDLLGYAVGTYRRGVDFRYFGTTLVAAIDAMFALKCAVNANWKNRVGLYHPAVYSATDNTAFFGTLSDADVREGFAEMMKWALAGDRRLFAILEAHGPRMCAERFAGADRMTRGAIARTMRGMMRELYRNPYEARTARKSYLGHGLSPGIEPDVTHGQAVTLEILAITMVAHLRGMVDSRYVERVVDVYRGVGMPLWHSVLEEPERLVRALADTTLHRGQRQEFTTPYRRVGKVRYLDDLSRDDILGGLDLLHGHAHRV